MLLYLLTPEGTVSCTEGSAGTSYTYNYFKRDQVGSTRAVLSAVGNTLQNVQSTDYYPFGLAHATNNLNKNKILFSGKELQDATVGGAMLGLYDFGARSFDPMIGRWITQDPAKQYASPYVYCRNNPISFLDPTGMKDTMRYDYSGPDIVIQGYHRAFYAEEVGWMLRAYNNREEWEESINSNDDDYRETEDSGGSSSAKEQARQQRLAQTKQLYHFLRQNFPSYKFANKIQLYYDPLLYATRKAYGITSPKLTADGLYLVRISSQSTASEFALFMTLGHELIHVAHFMSIPQGNLPSSIYQALTEAGSYYWNEVIIHSINPNASTGDYGVYRQKYESRIPYDVDFQTKERYFQYNKYGLPTIYQGPLR